MSNRIVKKKVSTAPAPFVETPASMRHSFTAQVVSATDDDVVQVHVTTKRQATTKDCFRLTPPNGPDEICVGWRGLAHYFNEVEVADAVCYLTAMRMYLYPEKPEMWFTRAKNFTITREPVGPDDGGAGVRMPKNPQDLLPPPPGPSKAEAIPLSSLSVPITTPAQLEKILMGG